MYNTLPFKKMPACLIIEMVAVSTFWWNSFPPVGEVSDTLSPCTLVTGLEVALSARIWHVCPDA